MVTFKSSASFSDNKISDVANPVDPQDAATRSWVEAAIAGVPGGLDTEGVQDIVGGMFTGNTESGLTIDYDDPTGKMNVTVTDAPLVGGFTAAQLRDRSTHTGTQAIGTITGHDKALHDALGIDAGTLEGSTSAQLQAAIIAAIVDSAPGTLDTLNELAAALGDDPNFAATTSTALGLRVQSFSQTVGNAADTAIVVTHNLNTRKVIVQVYDSATYDTVIVDTVRTTVNAVTLNFATAPTSGQYTVVVQGVVGT